MARKRLASMQSWDEAYPLDVLLAVLGSAVELRILDTHNDDCGARKLEARYIAEYDGFLVNCSQRLSHQQPSFFQQRRRQSADKRLETLGLRRR